VWKAQQQSLRVALHCITLICKDTFTASCRDRIKQGQYREQGAARVIAEILRTIAQVTVGLSFLID
jgi:hypothetical protein